MQALTETRAPCAGTDMTPIGPTAVQRSKDAAMLIRAYCRVCPVPEMVNFHDMRLGASGVWGGQYYPPKNESVDGYHHGFLREDGYGRSWVKWTRAANHPADPRCPECATRKAVADYIAAGEEATPCKP